MRTIILFLLLAPSVFPQQNKQTVAVLDFQGTGGIISSEVMALTNRFRVMLVQTNSFAVIERDKMKNILLEQNFVMSDNCNSAECAVQVGQLLGVESMIAGDIGRVGSTYTIDLRLIDVRSGEIVITRSEDYKGEVDGLLEIMKQTANSFAGINIDGNKKVTEKKVDLYFSSTPAGATILFDGSPFSNPTPTFVEKVSIGKHRIKLTKNNLFAEKEIDISDEPLQKFDFVLEPHGIPLRLLSDPIGAEVYLDDLYKGVTPLFLKAPLQEVKIEFLLRGYKMHTYTAQLTYEDSNRLINPVLKKLHNITLTTKPENLTVKVNNRTSYNSPVQLVDTGGVYEFEIAGSDLYHPFKQSFVVTSDTSLNISLVSKFQDIVKNGAIVDFITRPEGATIIIDNVNRGESPLTLMLEHGQHKLEMHKRGFQPYIADINIKNDQKKLYFNQDLNTKKGVSMVFILTGFAVLSVLAVMVFSR